MASLWNVVACTLGIVPCQYFSTSSIGSIPSYVIDYAPIVYLHSTETYFPAPISYQLDHTTPLSDSKPLAKRPVVLNLNTLDALNIDSASGNGGDNGGNRSHPITLSSVQDATKLPSWLHGAKPDGRQGRVSGSPSSAFITRDLGNGTLFAFYMFFYPFNQGQLGIGNHVGDWEHFALRFDHAQPVQAWYSQHSDGSAYTYDCLEKEGRRPVVYSGNGTHANYASANVTHLSSGFAKDYTDRGTRWDPALSAYLVSFEPDEKHVAHGRYVSYVPGDTGSRANVPAPTAWLSYTGLWGDDQLANSDPRQKGSGVLALWTAGPTGPQDKNLARDSICLKGGTCKVMTNRTQDAG